MIVLHAISYAVAGVVIFALGLLAGYYSRATEKRDDNGRFGEALNLWRGAAKDNDRLTQRFAFAFDSIRERLTELEKNRREGKDSLTDHPVGSNHLSDNGRSDKGVPRTKNSTDALIKDANDIKVKVAHERDLFLCEIIEATKQEVPLDDLLDLIYSGLRRFVSFQRMGFAEIDYDADRVTAVWAYSKTSALLKIGYSAKLSHSSLHYVAEKNLPRVLNNLPEYLRRHPTSNSTRLIVEEGYRSSLTLPISSEGTVVGFLFLSSIALNAFSEIDIPWMEQLAELIGLSLHPVPC